MELHIGLVSRVARTEHFIDFLSSQSLGWYCFFPINVRFLFLLSSLFCNQGMCAGRGSRNIFQLLSWLSDPRLLYSLPVLEIPRRAWEAHDETGPTTVKTRKRTEEPRSLTTSSCTRHSANCYKLLYFLLTRPQRDRFYSLY